ncbi:MAG TPA: hypothetical protein VH438_04325 [Gemmatimonadales bacterium]
MGVYLLVGDPQDPWCLAVRSALEAGHNETRTIRNPFADPAFFSWRLDNEQSTSRLSWAGEEPLAGDRFSGVFVRGPAWIDATEWQPDDLAYMLAETQAALVAWLWSLDCPVVNRYPAAIWYQPRAPLLLWHPLLRHCGLPTLETVITNMPQETRALKRRLADAGVAGVVYEPLTSPARYLVTSDDEWGRLEVMQGYAPACFPYPYGDVHCLCVVGDHVVWQDYPGVEAARLEPALIRFSAATGLAFVELTLAPGSSGLCVVGVEPFPRYDHFDDVTQQRIAGRLAQMLAARPDHSPAVAGGSAS